MNTGETRRLLTRSVEMLVAGIDRNGEERITAPFETVLLSVGGLDRGRAIALHDVHHVFVNVLHRAGLRARW